MVSTIPGARTPMTDAKEQGLARRRPPSDSSSLRNDPTESHTEVTEAFRAHPRVIVVRCHPRLSEIGVACVAVRNLCRAEVAMVMVPTGAIWRPPGVTQRSTSEIRLLSLQPPVVNHALTLRAGPPSSLSVEHPRLSILRPFAERTDEFLRTLEAMLGGVTAAVEAGEHTVLPCRTAASTARPARGESCLDESPG